MLWHVLCYRAGNSLLSCDLTVPFVLRDHGNGNSYAVRARVSDAGGNPRVVAVENLRQLFVILGKEAQALES